MMDQKTEDSNFEDDQLELIGDLITKVESILSPKPKNVWHLPGAQQRILSSMLLILYHGCKEDSEGKPKLWSFIFGLRVIRPDLWPNYELKYSGGNISNEELVSLWLQISLQTHLLPYQLKALIGDRKRISAYFHPWAFITSEIYTDSLLIVLQALEHNSQDILARVNPSLMVKYYSKKKKDQQKELFPVSVTENMESKEPIVSSDNSTNTKHLSVNKVPESNGPNSNENLSVWEDDISFTASKISPSFFQVDYSSSVFSDSEKTDVSPKRASDLSVINNSCTIKSFPISLPRNKESRNIDERQSDEHSLRNRTSKEFKGLTSTSKDYIHNNDIVKPSPFLLKYLESKSKFSLTESCEFLQNASCTNESGSSASQYTLPSINIEDTSNSESQICASIICSEEISIPSASAKLSHAPKNFKISTNEKSNIVATCVPRRSHVRSYSDGVKSIVTEQPPFSPVSTSYSNKFSSSSSHISVKKSFMEDGGKSITNEADGFFPHPEPGQTLIDFLTSNQFSKTSALLDRENAHFSIAEAVLAALEQINFESSNVKNKKPVTVRLEESEDDVLHFKQLPSNRRKLRVRSTIPSFAKSSDDEPATTDYSVLDSPEPESSNSSDSETISSLSEIHNQVDDALDSQTESSVDPSSAENVAIAILMHYNSKLLPKASDLQWLVSEQDVPQKLLPLPNSIPVSPDDAEGENFHPLLRGTLDWAPPRPQLILTLHKNTKRKARLQIQNWRCAGCGLLVSEKLSGHFRLCHYLGRYFCTSCHTNKKAVIPAKVLHNWDFKKYVVCNFSSELLSRMSPDPLFHLGTLNPRLYKVSRDLHQAHIYRLQLYHARIYIITCNRASKERVLLERFPPHWSTEPHVYSLDDLLSVKNGQIISQIKQLTTTLLTHISKCQICLGQGFICEICREGSPIFPFQLDAVTQCTKCKECFHFLCFSPNRPCPRCQRRDKREGVEEGGSDR